MRKKRILFCSEATFLNTGYATYTREVLTYLLSTGKYELAELAAYGERNDPRASGIPWKYYGVMPNTESEPKATREELEQYGSQPTNQFGEFLFEAVCLDFRPDIVCDIRDFWMLDFAERSPFRRFFNWCIMPTVDARPQARQWVSTYQGADACFTYSDWAGKVLEDQSGGKINYLGSAPPSAHAAYKPVANKDIHKVKFGIDPSTNIIGTVMRNQRRKLYPDLFEAFRKYIDNTGDNKTMLYCHTSYPDLGWDIPELLQEHRLSSRVLFTYICGQTGQPFPSLFKGAVIESPFTRQFGAVLSSVKTGVSYEQLSDIMNLFDLYVQYANCEGFGLPQVEAAACGIPVMGTDYSAMESVLRKLEGFPITPKALYKELETGCLRAVPDNDLAAKKFEEFLSLSKDKRQQLGDRTRELFEQHYQWGATGKKWEEYFDSTEIVPWERTWESAPRINQPAEKPEELPPNASPKDLARWLITDVLREPERINSFFEARLVRDLMYQATTSTTGGMYFNESSQAFDGQATRSPFNFDMAYDHLSSLCNRRNMWEQRRMEVGNE
jgi:glycosyltransferase involved in cell wall biosynthesis